MDSKDSPKAKIYTRYPWSSIFIYNGSTVAHYLLGGYGFSPLAAWLFASSYLVFSFVEMYVVMPLTVCPNCIYYRMDKSRCISGLNVVSKMIAHEGNQKNFANRAQGLFCFYNMYIALFVIPILAVIPVLFVNFSYPLLIVFFALIALFSFRFFVIFLKIACLHCAAKYVCPQTGSMGVREL